MQKCEIDPTLNLGGFKPCQIYIEAKDRPSSVQSTVSVSATTKEEWTEFVDQLFDRIFKKNLKIRFSITDQRFVYSLAIYSTPSAIFQYIKEKLEALAQDLIHDIVSSKDSSALHTEICELHEKITYLELIFAPIFQQQNSFYNILRDKFKDALDNNESLRKSLSSLLSDLFIDKDEENIKAFISFLKNINALQYYADEIFFEAFKLLNSKFTSAEMYNAFLVLMNASKNCIDTSVLYKIAGIFAKNFVSEISSQTGIIDEEPNTVRALSIVFKSYGTLNDSYRKFGDFLGKNAKEAAKDDKLFQKLIKFESFLLSIPQIGQIGRSVLVEAIEKSIGATKEQVTRIIASEVSRIALEGPSAVTDESINSIIRAFSWMGDIKLFEELYIAGLVDRILDNKPLDADFILSEKLEKIMPQLSSKIKHILEDTYRNREAIKEFLKSKSAPFELSISILQSYIVKSEKFLNAKFPDQVQPFFDDFTKFYIQRINNRALLWHVGLSRCELKAQGFKDLINLECDGVVANILLSIGQEGNSLEELSEKTGVESQELEPILQTLTNEKCHKILIRKESKYFVNEDVECDSKGFIELPTISEKTPSAQVFEHSSTFASREAQIDAAIVRTLKGGNSLTDRDLIAFVQREVEFPITEDMFQRRIRSLIARQFLERDGTKIAYLP